MRYALLIMLMACGEKADDTATEETEEVVDETLPEDEEVVDTGEEEEEGEE